MIETKISVRAWAGLALAMLVCAFPPVLAQTAPSLGQADSFSVLGASAVTNTGSSVLTGDLGIWPSTDSSITGFPPGIVMGTTHAGDAVALQAQSDLTTAYNDLAGRACDTVLTDTDLGGLTLTPGVYCFTSSAQLTGTLTLDAQGDADAVFIFQIGTSLTTASNAAVVVSNGGSNCNVYWQVGSSATLGTTTTFAGNILALTSITLNTGASVSGRLLARNGAVTLDSNDTAVCAAACGPINLSPVTLPDGVPGTPYLEMITATGGVVPYRFELIAGSLPSGLLLSNSGEISGTPDASGSFTFTVRATDANDCFGSQVYTIEITPAVCAAITVTPQSLPPVIAGEFFSLSISAVGGTAPITFSVTSGSLPAGVSLSADGMLSGTISTAGDFAFTVTATDALRCTGARAYSVTSRAPVVPQIVPALSPWGLVVLMALFPLMAWSLFRAQRRWP